MQRNQVMNAFNNSIAADISPLKKMELKLEKESVGGKHKKVADFSEAYPIIEQHLARQVPVSVVLEAFSASYGYTLHVPRFRQLLDAERTRRAEDDEELLCKACDNPLKLMPAVGTGGTIVGDRKSPRLNYGTQCVT